jgi:hypothetical protein
MCPELGSNKDQPRFQKLRHAASRQMQTCRSNQSARFGNYRPPSNIGFRSGLSFAKPQIREASFQEGATCIRGFEGLSEGTFPHSAIQRASRIPGMHGSFSNLYPRFYRLSDSLGSIGLIEVHSPLASGSKDKSDVGKLSPDCRAIEPDQPSLMTSTNATAYHMVCLPESFRFKYDRRERLPSIQKYIHV